MLNKLICKAVANKLMNNDKIKKEKEKKQLQREHEKNSIIRTCGRARYYLSWWFGEWILFAYNTRPILEEKEYTKFYKDKNVAERYARQLREKYEIVDITTVFDNYKRELGYLVTAAEKVAEPEPQQPSNVIPFRKPKFQ